MFFVGIIFFIFIPKTSYQNLNISINASRNSVLSDEKPHPAILGGYEASFEDFPFAVRLYISHYRTFTMCTGQAVHRTLILTAAHCVREDADVVVVTGKANHEDYTRGYRVSQYARYKVIRKYIHPEFDRRIYMHDIALLKTGRPMMHSGYELVPLCYTRLETTKEARIFGWGKTEINEDNDLLYAKRLDVRGCTVRLVGRYARFICLMEAGINHGDSGGGLLIGDELYGIASFYNPIEDVRNRYFFTAISEEAEFVKSCIERNTSNYDSCFTPVAFLSFLFLFLFLR